MSSPTKGDGKKWEDDAIKVCVRMRPLVKDDDGDAWSIVSDQSIKENSRGMAVKDYGASVSYYYLYM